MYIICSLAFRLLASVLSKLSGTQKAKPEEFEQLVGSMHVRTDEVVRFMVGYSRSGVRWVFRYGRSISFLHRMLGTKYFGYILFNAQSHRMSRDI